MRPTQERGVWTLSVTCGRRPAVDRSFWYLPDVRPRYEQFMQGTTRDRAEALHGVADFLTLGVRGTFCRRRSRFSSEANHSESARVHVRPMSSYVKNWPAVVATLRGTRFEKYLTLDGSSLSSPLSHRT